MLHWSDAFLTGDAIIDDQHRTLIGQLNRLEELLTEPSFREEACLGLLDEIAVHVTAHFEFEDDCMVRTQCPARLKNQQAHTAFLELFGSYRERLKGSHRPIALVRDLHQVACDWTTSHILSLDVKMKPCARHSRSDGDRRHAAQAPV